MNWVFAFFLTSQIAMGGLALSTCGTNIIKYHPRDASPVPEAFKLGEIHNWDLFKNFFGRRFTYQIAEERSNSILQKADSILAFINETYPSVPPNFLRENIKNLSEGDLLKEAEFDPMPHSERSSELPLRGWVKTDEEWVSAYKLLASSTKIRFGRVQFPEVRQSIDNRIFFGHLTPFDQNRIELYVDQLVLILEEHYHLAQYLRIYANLPGSQANISQWARSHPNKGQRFDLECDVYAHLKEKFPALGPHWAAPYARRFMRIE